MDIATLALFVPACFALNMAPGPNNLLSLSNATRHGFKRSCAAGAGRLLAFTGMLVLVSTGLAAVLHASELIFNGIKIAGAAYLFYLAIQLWRASSSPVVETSGTSTGWWALARQEFLVAAGNPKAILIFTAFLPQFVEVSAPLTPQFAWLGATFLVLELVAMVAYACLGLYARRWFALARGRRIFNRCCATLLAGAGVGLLFSRRAS